MGQPDSTSVHQAKPTDTAVTGSQCGFAWALQTSDALRFHLGPSTLCLGVTEAFTGQASLSLYLDWSLNTVISLQISNANGWARLR